MKIFRLNSFGCCNVNKGLQTKDGRDDFKVDPTVEPVSTVESFSGVKSFSVDTSLHLAALAVYRQLSPKWSKPAWADNSESKRACLLAETPGPLLFAAHWSRHGGTSFGRASSGSFLP